MQRNEEILFSYGRKHNWALLRAYGFVQFDNLFDVSDLDVPVYHGLKTDRKKDKKKKKDAGEDPCLLDCARLRLSERIVRKSGSEEESPAARAFLTCDGAGEPVVRIRLQHGEPSEVPLMVARMISLRESELLEQASILKEIEEVEQEEQEGASSGGVGRGGGSSSGGGGRGGGGGSSKRAADKAPASTLMDFTSPISESNELQAREVVAGLLLEMYDKVLGDDSPEELAQLEEEARESAGVGVGEGVYTCVPQAVAVACRTSKMLVLENMLNHVRCDDSDEDEGEEGADEEEEEEGK